MSFIADLLGNAGLAGEKVIGKQIEQNYALERQQHDSDLAMDRAKAAEALKLDLQEKQRQAQMKRGSEQMQQAEAGGQEIAKSRALEMLNQSYGSNHTLADVLPEELDAFAPKAGPLTAIEDQRAFARKNGLYDAEAQLKGAYDETVKAMRLEYDQRMGERKEDRKDAELKETGRKADLQHEASRAQTAAYAARQSKSDHQGATEKLTTEKARALQELSILMDKGNRKADGPRIDSIKAYLVELDGLLAERRGSESKAPAKPDAAPAKPSPSAGYKDGTELKGPGGKIYVVKNGVPVPK